MCSLHECFEETHLNWPCSLYKGFPGKENLSQDLRMSRGEPDERHGQEHSRQNRVLRSQENVFSSVKRMSFCFDVLSHEAVEVNRSLVAAFKNKRTKMSKFDTLKQQRWCLTVAHRSAGFSGLQPTGSNPASTELGSHRCSPGEGVACCCLWTHGAESLWVLSAGHSHLVPGSHLHNANVGLSNKMLTPQELLLHEQEGQPARCVC